MKTKPVVDEVASVGPASVAAKLETVVSAAPLTAPQPPQNLQPGDGPPAKSVFGEYAQGLPFFLMHVAPLGALWTGVNTRDWVVCVMLYWVRMFGVTGVYHRYFSHRTYKTSRVFQFCLAFLAQTTSQKGALWWAAHHRVHHKYSDTDRDPHDSRRGFWYSHVGWLFAGTTHTDYDRVKDLAKYPELVWLNRFWALPPIALGVAVWLALGWSGLFIAFCLSTVLVWHGTFTINSLSHMFGTQRYDAGDTSRNNWLLAIITMGEGWHNNHHHYMTSTRQGFYWWEYDASYYVIKALSYVGLVWDVREPPAHVFDESTFLANLQNRRELNTVSDVSAPALPAPAMPSFAEGIAKASTIPLASVPPAVEASPAE